MLSIVTDIQSMQINKNLTTATNAVNTALERMSTGYKVNCAADDAAGLFLSSTMTAQLRGSQQAIKNISDGISLLQTADGALSNMTDILARLRDLSVQSANGVYDEKSREAFQREADALTEQLKQILEGTSFNGKTLLQTSENPTLASALTLSGGGGNPNNLTRASFRVIDPNQTASSQIPKSTTPPVLKNTTSTTSTTPET